MYILLQGWCSGLRALAAGEQHETIMWKAEIVYFTLFPPDIRKGRKILCFEPNTEIESQLTPVNLTILTAVKLGKDSTGLMVCDWCIL